MQAFLPPKSRGKSLLQKAVVLLQISCDKAVFSSLYGICTIQPYESKNHQHLFRHRKAPSRCQLLTVTDSCQQVAGCFATTRHPSKLELGTAQQRYCFATAREQRNEDSSRVKTRARWHPSRQAPTLQVAKRWGGLRKLNHSLTLLLISPIGEQQKNFLPTYNLL